MRYQKIILKLTSHSLWPWKPSWFNLFTAITIPVPGFVATNVCSSIQPLKTEPKPPSPNTLSGRKFLVAFRRSLKVKLFTLDDCKISPSLRGVGGTEVDDTLLLEPLNPLTFLLLFLEVVPEHSNMKCITISASFKMFFNNSYTATINWRMSTNQVKKKKITWSMKSHNHSINVSEWTSKNHKRGSRWKMDGIELWL